MNVKKIDEKQIEQILNLYKNNFSIYKISKKLNITAKTIKKKLIEKKVYEDRNLQYDYSSRKKDKFDKDIAFKLYVIDKKSLKEIADLFNVHKETVKNFLKILGVDLYDKKNTTKGEPSLKEKEEIIKLYNLEHRGAKYIGSLYGRSDFSITYWLNKWGVKKISRSDIQKKNREIYGPTKGFFGKKHTNESKEQISKSGTESWNKESRIPTIGKSRTFSTKIGKVLGSYEVAYLQKLINEGINLPKPNRKKIKTPYGNYTPDFDFGDKFIEIKSDFTLRVCKGEMPHVDGTYSDKQWKKIQWANENKKPVEIIVLEKNDAFNLFVQAINTKFVLDDVEIRNKQYKIINN
jgi:transposase